MTNFVTGIVGLAAVSAFLGTMVWWIKALPLILIVVFVLLLLLVDFVQSLRGNGNGTRS